MWGQEERKPEAIWLSIMGILGTKGPGFQPLSPVAFLHFASNICWVKWINNYRVVFAPLAGSCQGLNLLGGYINAT